MSSNATNPEKEWTLMFYFATDNPLAPSAVTQLKALTNAGFHQEVNVVLQFDPYAQDTPTHIFEVNMINKLDNQKQQKGDPRIRPYKFWNPNDPFVRNLVLDKLWNDNEKERPVRELVLAHIKDKFSGIDFELKTPTSERSKLCSKRSKSNGHGKAVAEAVAAAVATAVAPAEAPGAPKPKQSLEDYVKFCVDKYPARHYMLFLLGHGVVVGNDMFLYDEDATPHSLKLTELGDILKTQFKDKNKNLELLGLHGCSLSALEVACELQGKARFMIASQGTQYVGNWPYREILIRIFNDVIAEETSQDGINDTIKQIFTCILTSSLDFQMAGISFDLALCNLNGLKHISKPLGILSKKLRDGLELFITKRDPFIQERILLAHWDAQSYFEESYTDLFDFCSCLLARLEHAVPQSEEQQTLLDDTKKACEGLIYVLKRKEDLSSKEEEEDTQEVRPIVSAGFTGPEYQYSRGLSIYFPWSPPTNRKFWKEEYPSYKFNQEFIPGEEPGLDGLWVDFLEDYWKATRREPVGIQNPTLTQVVLEEVNGLGGLLGASAESDTALKPIGSGAMKPIGSGAQGESCTCPSIKNYPSSTLRSSDHFEGPERKRRQAARYKF